MRINRYLIPILSLVVAVSLPMILSCSQHKTADFIIAGGPIYTMNPEKPIALAVSVQ